MSWKRGNALLMNAGLEFDSAVRAKGAKYVWAYRGLWSTAPPKR